MEISIAVQDTIDLIRSSVEEEIVFEATLQVPTHHVIACRIEAYGTPFNAPALQADPSQWSEDDHQFAACLAAPPDVEEVPSFSLTRTATFIEHRVPGLREAPALASLSFSVRQRQNQSRTSSVTDPEDDLVPGLGGCQASMASSNGVASGEVDSFHSGADSSHRRSLEKPATDSRRRSYEKMTAAGGVAHSRTHLQPVIMEEAAFEDGPVQRNQSLQASGQVALDQHQQQQQDDSALDRALSRLHSRRGLVRMESLGPQGRTQQESSLAVEPGSRGLAALVGVGYFLMQQWAERFQRDYTRKRHINMFSAIIHPKGSNAHLVVQQQDCHPLAEVTGAAPCVSTPAAVVQM
eukprot:gene11854-11998_t